MRMRFPFFHADIRNADPWMHLRVSWNRPYACTAWRPVPGWKRSDFMADGKEMRTRCLRCDRLQKPSCGTGGEPVRRKKKKCRFMLADKRKGCSFSLDVVMRCGGHKNGQNAVPLADDGSGTWSLQGKTDWRLPDISAKLHPQKNGLRKRRYLSESFLGNRLADQKIGDSYGITAGGAAFHRQGRGQYTCCDSDNKPLRAYTPASFPYAGWMTAKIIHREWIERRVDVYEA